MFASRRAGYRLREHSTERDRWMLITVLISGIALTVPAALAMSGALSNLDARPPAVALLIGAMTVGTVVLAFSPFGTRLIKAWSLWALVGFQAFRILVEVLLAGAHWAGIVPEEVTWMGWNFDVLVGLSALAIGYRARQRPLAEGLIWVWNVVGVVLLAVVVTTAARSAFGFLETEPRMTLPATWPGVWLPTWLVQLGLFGHLLVFRKLLQKRQPSTRPEPIAPTFKEKTAWEMPRVTLADEDRPSSRTNTPRS